MLFNINTLQWDEDLLKLLNVPASMLPEVRSSSEVYGRVATTLGVGDVAVAGIAGDQQAALFGQMCVTPGLTKNTYGTGCFLLQNTGERPVVSQNRLLTTVAWQVGGKTMYALEGSVFIGGAVVQWLRDGLGLIRQSSDVEALAASVPDSGGVYLVPAFAGLGAPHWDPYARGTIVGITRGTTAGHIARAALESIAFQVADLLDAVGGDAGIALAELRVDGGAAANDALLQFQADLLGVPVVRPEVTETTALGAAYLAGLAVGFWDSTEALAQHWRADKRFEPSMPPAQVTARRAEWREALNRVEELDRTGQIAMLRLGHDRAAGRPPRAMGHRRHRRRRHRRGHRGRCGQPWVRRAAARAARLREGHVEPQHQAGARRRALSRTGQHRAGDGGAEGARPASPERATPGQQPRLRRPELRLVGGAVLRPRPQGLQRARRQVRLRHLRDPLARGDAGAAADDQDRRAARRRRVLRRPVRRRAAADQPGGDGGRPGRDAGQLRAGGRHHQGRRRLRRRRRRLRSRDRPAMDHRRARGHQCRRAVLRCRAAAGRARRADPDRPEPGHPPGVPPLVSGRPMPPSWCRTPPTGA